MNYRIRKSLEKFLNEKMKKIHVAARDYDPQIDLSFIKTSKGFELADNSWLCPDGFGTYRFHNNNGCQCYFIKFHREEQKNKSTIEITIDYVCSYRWYETSVGILYRCMDEINEIAEEFRELKGELEKQDKINEIAKNSINTWLKALMQNQSYSYYTTESENKITLSIKIKNRMQLDIPVYYNRFQKIIHELPETIQEFEKISNKSKIKVLISNSSPNQQWTTTKE